MEQVFPRLMEFQADVILVSAGFDAHACDPIHRSSDTEINEFDYKWLTENLQKIANATAEGRLISVLEGGYNVKLGHMSPLAQSVGAHVRALNTTPTGGFSLEPKFVAEQQFIRECLQKRANENKADLFKEVGLGMTLRKR